MFVRNETTIVLFSRLEPCAGGPEFTAYVRALPVQDFDRVRAGQVPAEIVDDDYRAAVAQIIAGIAALAERNVAWLLRRCASA